jgi:predicted DNA-binding protein with PD1-like motif
MEYIRHKEHIAIRLDPGDDLLASLKSVLEKEQVQDGAVVSGIGTFDCCTLHFVDTITDPGSAVYKKWEDTPLEVNGIQGIIAEGNPHLHATVSTAEQCWCGHVEPGCRTLYLCELMVVIIEGFHLSRKQKSSENPIRYLTKK